MPHVETSDGRRWRAERVVVCGGVDFQTLFPEMFVGSGIRRCKLQNVCQLLRSKYGWADSWTNARGRTHSLALCELCFVLYRSTPFAIESRLKCPSTFVPHGIHVMASQNVAGEVVIGDLHEYDNEIEPFDKTAIDDLILAYLSQMVRLPDNRIAARSGQVSTRSIPRYRCLRLNRNTACTSSPLREVRE